MPDSNEVRNLEEHVRRLIKWKETICPVDAQRDSRQVLDGIRIGSRAFRPRVGPNNKTKGHHLGRPSLSEDKLGVALGG